MLGSNKTMPEVEKWIDTLKNPKAVRDRLEALKRATAEREAARLSAAATCAEVVRLCEDLETQRGTMKAEAAALVAKERAQMAREHKAFMAMFSCLDDDMEALNNAADHYVQVKKDRAK